MPKIKAIHELRFSHPKTGEAVIVAPGKEATVSAEDAKLFLAAGAAQAITEEVTDEQAAAAEKAAAAAEKAAAEKKTKDKKDKKDADKDLI